MHRSATRRNDERNNARGGMPPGKVPPLGRARDAIAPGEPSPMATDAVHHPEKAPRRSRPLTPSTNSAEHDVEFESAQMSMRMASAPSQWKMCKSPNENEDWILDQQAPPLPIMAGRSRARSRTISAGGTKHKVKSEDRKPRPSFSQDDAGVQQTGKGDQTPLKRAGREPTADDLGTTARRDSTSQDKQSPLKRRISWGRNKKEPQESAEEESNYKRASRLGLPDVEKELVPSLRDTVHKMTSDQRTSNDTARYTSRNAVSVANVYSSANYSTALLPPSRDERPSSSLQSTASSPARKTSTKSKHPPRAESHFDPFTRESLTRPKSSKMVDSEDDIVTKDLQVKPKSILKSALKTPRSVKKFQSQSPNLDADDSASEPLLRTPRVRSSSRSPLLSVSASPARTASNIPSPRVRSRSSSSTVPAGKSPNSAYTPGHKSPRIFAGSRSPMLTAHEVDSSSRSPRSAPPSSKLKASVRLPSPKSPALSRVLNERTPKVSRVPTNKGHQSTTESDSSSDEKIHLNDLPSSKQTYSASPLHFANSGFGNRSPKPSENLAMQMQTTEQSTSEFSEHEGVQDEKSEDSHVRRKNELVDLVAGLKLDLGPQNDGSYPSAAYKNPSHSRRLESSTDQDQIVGIAKGGSGWTTEREQIVRVPNDDKHFTVHHVGRSTQHEHQNDRSTRRSSFQGRRLSIPRPGADDPGMDDDRTNSLLKPDRGNVNRDSLLMLNADHQREAFGIPPSSSNVREGGDILSCVESNTSLMNAALGSDWEGEANDDLGLSHGAEKLFHALGIGADAQHTEVHFGKDRRNSWRCSMAEAEKYLTKTVHPVPAPMSASSSASSIYEDDIPNRPWQKRERDLDRVQTANGTTIKQSWKTTLSQSAYLSLRDRHGDAEMRRQEVIWVICETEQAFLKSLRIALKSFVHPLLGKNRTWISGLPSKVSRLLDWLEDIFQLHAQICSALQHTRSSQYPVILRIAETLRAFVPRLEIYQPYIVRLDEVVEEIEEMVKDPRSDLGEFFRIQSSKEDCAGMTFSSFLWMPLMRLGRYLKYFNELWALTPRSHVDHLATFSLLHSATMVIRVMREVKLREEEHMFVKELASRVKGLPNSMELIQRERRLVAHGVLQRIHLSDRSRNMLEGNSPAHASRQGTGRRHVYDGRSGDFRRSAAPRRRANSLDSCLSEAASMSSISSAASTSTLGCEDIMHHDFRTHNDGEATYHSHLRRNERAEESRDKSRAAQLYAFIFNDLAIFSSIRHSNDENSQDALELLDDIGICRILSVTDHSGNLGYDHLIGLHVLPMDIEQLGNGILSDIPATSLFIHLSNTQSSAEKLADARKRWQYAFEQCYRFTLRSLSFPAHTGKYLAHGLTGSDQDEHTRQTVMDILASGLPLPKSPSVQMGEVEKNAAGDATLREREERGWWSLRFQQTLNEMQRDDTPVPLLQRTSSVTASPSTPRRKTVSGRRRLKLGNER